MLIHFDIKRDKKCKNNPIKSRKTLKTTHRNIYNIYNAT